VTTLAADETNFNTGIPVYNPIICYWKHKHRNKRIV